MAILTFEMEEGEIEHINADAVMLRYRLLFGRNQGWLHCERAQEFVVRIRDVREDEAGELWAFLARGGRPEAFKTRMAPDDWNRLAKGRGVHAMSRT